MKTPRVVPRDDSFTLLSYSILRRRGDAPLILATMARLGRLGFLAIAVVFHLVYILSIFDIYFVSPIVSGMREYSLDAKEPPAKRLVLFVGMLLARASKLKPGGARRLWGSIIY